MAALLLANIHAPDFKPATTSTDLRDRHSVVWLAGFSVMYCAAPEAAMAWALTKALLDCDLSLQAWKVTAVLHGKANCHKALKH